MAHKSLYSYVLVYPDLIKNRDVNEYNECDKLSKQEKEDLENIFLSLGAIIYVKKKNDYIFVNFSENKKLIPFAQRDDVKKGIIKLTLSSNEFVFDIRAKYEYCSIIKISDVASVNHIDNNINNIKRDTMFNNFIIKDKAYLIYTFYFTNKRDMNQIIKKYLTNEAEASIKEPLIETDVYNMIIDFTYMSKLDEFKACFEKNIKNIHNMHINRKSKEGNDEYMKMDIKINELNLKIRELKLCFEHIDEFKPNLLS